MTSNRKTIILEQQNSKKTTVTPNALNEMNHDQMDMVSGSFGVIANNTNLNVFASNFSNGTAPILTEKNSTVEVEQSSATGKKSNVDNSKFVVAIDNNNIQIDNESETKSRITRKSAVDISNSTNFPSPNPRFADFSTVSEINGAKQTSSSIIAAGPVVNNGIDFGITSPSAGILLKNTIIDLSSSYITFYGVDISTNNEALNEFIKNLPRDLNGNILTFKLDKEKVRFDLNFEKFFGGKIVISGSYRGNMNFTECKNVVFDEFEYDYGKITFKYCENVRTIYGVFTGQFDIFQSKCHFINGKFRRTTNPNAIEKYAIIHRNENAQVLFDHCDIADEVLVTVSYGSQISSVNDGKSSKDLLDKNFKSENRSLINDNRDAEHTTNHFHIVNEHAMNSYPIGSVYGWPRAFTFGDLTRVITSGNLPDNYQVSILPTIFGLTSNYFPSGDLPLDMVGSYTNSPYNIAATNYETIHGIKPVGIQTSTNLNVFCVFDWYKLYEIENDIIQIVKDEFNNGTTIKNSTLHNDKLQSLPNFVTDDNIYFRLYTIDPGNVNSSRTASCSVNWNISTNGFYVSAWANGEGTNVELKFHLNLSGLKKYIPENILNDVYFSYVVDNKQYKITYAQYLTGLANKNNGSQNSAKGIYVIYHYFKTKSSFTLKDICLYIPYISVLGKTENMLISTEAPLYHKFDGSTSSPQNSYHPNGSYEGHNNYDYNMPPQFPHTMSLIKISPYPRNCNLSIGDWYICSDTILSVKTGNTYKSKNINNYNDEYLTMYEPDTKVDTYNYYVSKLLDSSKVVHDIGTTNMVKGAATGAINTIGSPQVYTNSIAAIGYNHYETIHDTDNDTLILFNGSTASGLPSTYTATDSVTNLFYTFNLDPHYEASINCLVSAHVTSTYDIVDVSGNIYTGEINKVPKIFPLIDNRNTLLLTDTTNEYISGIPNASSNSPLGFQHTIIKMLTKHEMVKCCEDFFKNVNGLAVANNIFNTKNLTSNVLSSYNSSFPSSNYVEFDDILCKEIFGSTVGAAYPMISGEFIGNDIYNQVKDEFTLHKYETTDKIQSVKQVNLPFLVSSVVYKPRYYGIPYLISDSYGELIFRKNGESEGKSYTSFIGGFPNLTGSSKKFEQQILLQNDIFNVGKNSNILLKINDKLLQINNLKLFHKDLKPESFPVSCTYNRRFYMRFNYTNTNITAVIYKNLFYSPTIVYSTSYNHGDNGNLNQLSVFFNNIIEKCSEYVKESNDVAIKFIYSGENTYTNSFTNISNQNKNDIIYALNTFNSSISDTGVVVIDKSYNTEMIFNEPYEWEIFYRHYMHKINFVMSKLNRFYRCTINGKNSSAHIGKYVSLINILNYAPFVTFSGIDSYNESNKFNYANNDYVIDGPLGVGLLQAVGKMRYPKGAYRTNKISYKDDFGITNTIDIIQTNDDLSGNCVGLNNLFLDCGWAYDSYSMNSIFGNSNYEYFGVIDE